MSRKIKKRKGNRNKSNKNKSKNDFIKTMVRMRADMANAFDETSTDISEKIRALYLQYSAEDIVVALNISDLWLPNISSQIKHHFAYGIFLEMNADIFNEKEKLDSYEKFCSFTKSLYQLLPSFPSLEDYIPEQDWGEIKISYGDNFRNIFYGSLVERIPDFIEAFRIINRNNVEALRDMDAAIILQDTIISNIDQELVGSSNGIYPGFIEIPCEEFWSRAKLILGSIYENFKQAEIINSKLIVDLGNFNQIKKFAYFGDAVMRGASLPFLMVRINKKLFPLSLRNVTSVVLDFWQSSSSDIDLTKVSLYLSQYLSYRIDNRVLVEGPLSLVTRKTELPYKFSAIIRGKRKFYLIIAVTLDFAPDIDKLENDIKFLMSGDEEWCFLSNRERQYVQFKKSDGSGPNINDFELIVILLRSETASIPILLPKTNARVMTLSEFVTIFDCIGNENELDLFWSYFDTHQPLMRYALNGITDIFASFRDSHSVLVDGAVKPTMISLNPHWGSNWRFKFLASFWSDVPPLFPDNTVTWNIESKHSETLCLTGKGKPILAWSTMINHCVFYAVFNLDKSMSLINGQMLELFVECLVDALSQAKNIISELPLFQKKRIVILCAPSKEGLANDAEDELDMESVNKPLFSEWQLNSNWKSSSLFIAVDINLARLQSRLDSPKDASFEVECVLELISGIFTLEDKKISVDLIKELESTINKKPRFSLKRTQRQFDVPDFTDPKIPSPAQYKIARRDLAILIKDQGARPGRYELSDAKIIIDIAKNKLREKIHVEIEKYSRNDLILFCIQQHDALAAKHKREVSRVKHSVDHEVSFNRSKVLADAYDKFSTGARNYRYLLEHTTTLKSKSSVVALEQDIIQLIASIDWLFVLYTASDVLHNDIDVVGLDLDDSFIPNVFYSDVRNTREEQFSLEIASLKLGLDLLENDEVNSEEEYGRNWDELDSAYFMDLGFSFTHLIQTFQILSHWYSLGRGTQLSLYYQASEAEILDELSISIDDLTKEEAKRLIDFVMLDPTQIRRLLGKTIEENDVPVWEHNKRGHRYNIRPVIKLENETLTWGAAACYRSGLIWIGSLTNGYLPADFDLPNVKPKVREIKTEIEKRLEIRAFEICSRHTTYVHHGIDFKFKFPKEGFDDVGDFDVLAYWPDKNHWIYIECKYNQPPFCLKDSRRLRERIFGIDSDHGQFAKIEKRRDFLSSNLDRLRLLMAWPSPKKHIPVTIDEVYVSRDIYWWMRNPPYEVPTSFVRIDGLDYWLRGKDLSRVLNIQE